jgi:transposase
MAAINMTELQQVRVTVGVDTHKDSHVAPAKDQPGRGLGQIGVPACLRGYADLLAWARSLGEIQTFGVEGTGCYGAGLSRYVRSEGCAVLEVIRPNPQARRRNGKSDPADADAAASAVLSGGPRDCPRPGIPRWR